MKPADLKILVQEGEGTTLEFKESLSASLAREMVALANTIGGKILLGVRDNGTVAGLKDSNTLRARVQDMARNCDPAVKVVVEPVGEVVVVHVHESDAKPVQCSEGFFWRQGAVTQKLSRDEIRDFFRTEGAIRFDLAPCPRFRYPQDFDRAKYNAWLKLSGITGRPRTEDVLVNIEAAERAGGKLLFRNAGVLFFARNVRHFFNQAYITCLLAKGTDKVHILDRKDFDDGVVADIEEALRFIERNTRLAYRIETLQRENIPEYPMKALREAITNAVMHRDWFVEGANVFVEIYTDRIEVVSPGGLPKGMTLADLGRKSVRRNALIADLLHRIGFIEKAGTGVKRIRDEARDGGYPEPEWEANGFVTTIFQPNPEVRAAAASRPGPSRDQVGTKSALSRHQGEILRKCLKEQPLTSLLKIAGRSDRTKFRNHVLAPLLAGGLLELTIPDKPRSSKQRYRLTEAGRAYLTKNKEPK
jgi:ATP-dependent DNA helicase RecG